MFTFHLTPVPLSLAHVDESINKTDKAKLLHQLESMVTSTAPSQKVDVILVDGMFPLHTLQNLPNTFEDVSNLILAKLYEMFERVDMICDTYGSPTVKDIEHARRSDETSYPITRPEQQRPKDWQKALLSASFKTFLRFLAEQWTRHSNIKVLAGHDVYLGIDEECHQYAVVGNQICHEKVSALASCHREADTRTLYHLCYILQQDDLSIVVRSSDTDSCVLLLFHVSKFMVTPAVWMDVSLSSNNTKRYINNSSLPGCCCL